MNDDDGVCKTKAKEFYTYSELDENHHHYQQQQLQQQQQQITSVSLAMSSVNSPHSPISDSDTTRRRKRQYSDSDDSDDSDDGRRRNSAVGREREYRRRDDEQHIMSSRERTNRDRKRRHWSDDDDDDYSGSSNSGSDSDTSSSSIYSSSDSEYSSDSSDDERRNRRRERRRRPSRGDERMKNRKSRSDALDKEDSYNHRRSIRDKELAPNEGKVVAAVSQGQDQGKESDRSILSKLRTGGVYIPPHKLRRIQDKVKDPKSVEYQRLNWDALGKSINGFINKVRYDTIFFVYIFSL